MKVMQEEQKRHLSMDVEKSQQRTLNSNSLSQHRLVNLYSQTDKLIEGSAQSRFAESYQNKSILTERKKIVRRKRLSHNILHEQLKKQHVDKFIGQSGSIRSHASNDRNDSRMTGQYIARARSKSRSDQPKNISMLLQDSQPGKQRSSSSINLTVWLAES